MMSPGLGRETGCVVVSSSGNSSRGILNRETRGDRAKNGGNLTNNEKARINHQQNKLSRNIYRDKHNAARQ